MHLFAGIGGGLLADLILGHRPIVAVEWEPYACQVLRERAAEGWFPDLRVWEGDVRMFDPSEYAGKVDCIHAGLPCQPYSAAGLQTGFDDPRGGEMWSETKRCISIVRPRYVFMENVPGFSQKALPYVSAEFSSIGYDGQWIPLSAARIGANHLRRRWWGLFTDSKWNDKWREKPCGWPSGRVGREQQSIPWDIHWESALSILRRMDDGIPNSLHRCNGIRNAQVPLQAAVAWKLLGGE